MVTSQKAGEPGQQACRRPGTGHGHHGVRRGHWPLGFAAVTDSPKVAACPMTGFRFRFWLPPKTCPLQASRSLPSPWSLWALGAQHCAGGDKSHRGSEVSWWEWPREASAPGDSASLCEETRTVVSATRLRLRTLERPRAGRWPRRPTLLCGDQARGGQSCLSAKARGALPMPPRAAGPWDGVPRAKQQRPPR